MRRLLLLLLWAGACVAPAPAYAAPLEDALFPRDFMGDAAKFTNQCGVWDGMSLYPVCRHGGSGVASAPPPVFQMAYTSSGPLILDDANTVAHVTWNGTALVDSKGNAWTQNGTVPQVTGATASPMFPNGFTSAPRAGAGPYSSSNYYDLPYPSALNFATGTSFTLCVVFNGPSNFSSNNSLSGNDSTGTSGWFLQIGTAGSPIFAANTTAATVATANTTVASGENVLCAGWDATAKTEYIQLNLGSLVTAGRPGDPYVSSTTQTNLGLNSGMSNPMLAAVYEAWFSTDTPSAASLAAIGERVLNEIANTGQVVADTRASTATYYTNDVRWTAPANVPRIEVFRDGGGGLLSEGASTNVLLNSEAPATQTTASLGTGPYTGSSLGTGGVTFAAATATATGLPCTTTTFLDVGEAGDCHFTITVAGTILATVVGSVTHEQLEGLAFRTSDIITGGTAVTRAADSNAATFSYTLGAQSMSESADVLIFGANAALNTFVQAYDDATDVYTLGNETTPKTRLNGVVASTAHVALGASAFAANAWHHQLGKYDGLNENACTDGACNPTSYTFTGPTSFAKVGIGDDLTSTGTAPLSGLIKNVCVGVKGACQ